MHQGKEMEKKQDKILKGLEEKRSKNKAEKEILFEVIIINIFYECPKIYFLKNNM